MGSATPWTNNELLRIERILNGPLAVVRDAQLQEIESRLTRLRGACASMWPLMTKDRPYLLPYLGNAFGDAYYLSFGARSKLLQLTEDPHIIADAIIRSSDELLAPSRMPDDAWQSLKDYWLPLQPCPYELPSDRLEIITEPTIRLALTDKAHADIDSYTTNDSGCPARGFMLERFFANYVQVVIEGPRI